MNINHFNIFVLCRIYSMSIDATMTLSDCLGFLSSLALYRKYREAATGEGDPLPDLANR